MTWIDSHCHLDHSALSIDIETVIKRCKENSIEGVVVPSICPSNMNDVIKLSDQFDICFFALGFHPFYAKDVRQQDFKNLSNLLSDYDAVAVGEIGLDKSLPDCEFDIQNKVFQTQLDIAEGMELPVIVHSRGMIDLVIKQLRKRKIKGGIIHAFNGSFQQAEYLINLGFKLGFGGVITYERATNIRALAKNLPLDTIVLETDSPDMRPAWVENNVPNEPGHLKKISQVLCDLRSLDIEELAKIIKRNTIEVLPKLSKLCT